MTRVLKITIIFFRSLYYLPISLLLLKEYLRFLPTRLKLKSIIYSCGVPVILGESYLRLRGVTLNNSKKEIMVLAATLIPIIDHINDHMNYDKEHLKQLYNIENNSRPQNNIETVYLDLIHNILELTQRHTRVRQAISSNLEAQLASLTQYYEKDNSKLKKILADKGGLGVIQYCTILDPQLTDTQEKTFYQLGFWLQLINDYKDQDKDIKDGINTLATNIKSEDEYKVLVAKEGNKALSLIESMLGNKEAKRNLVNNFRLFFRNQT